MKISIVIPTRNGSPYIEYCLKTCLDTDDQDLEVIVSDNFSTDDTQEIVTPFLADPRVRYFNTGKSVSMRQNYEFALGKVTGDYVIYIGDDDGLVRYGLSILRKILERYQPDAINWKIIDYTWPGTKDDHEKAVIRYEFNDLYKPIEFKDPGQILKNFCDATYTKYKSAASLYHGCLKRSIIEDLKTENGVFFQAHNPDVYSSLASLTRIKTFLTIGYPVTIGGESKKSTGLAMLGNTGVKDLTHVANSFISLAHADHIEGEIPLEIRSVAAITYACLCRVNEKVCNLSLPIQHDIWRSKIVDQIRGLPGEKRLKNEDILNDFFRRMDKHFTPQGKYEFDRGKEILPPRALTVIQKCKHRFIKIRPGHGETVETVASWFSSVAGFGFNPLTAASQYEIINKTRTLYSKIKSRII